MTFNEISSYIKIKVLLKHYPRKFLIIDDFFFLRNKKDGKAKIFFFFPFYIQKKNI
jgi:hypothetical protein